MEVSLVGKPTTANVAKACVICGTETDYLVAHKPDCKIDNCNCDIHVCSKTACEVRGLGRGIFHRTKINPRRNPMNIEMIEEDDDDEDEAMSNPNHDHDNDEEEIEEEMVDVVSNPQGNSDKKKFSNTEFPTEMEVECSGCGEPMKGIKTVFTSPTESHFEFDDNAGPEDAEIEFYEYADGEPLCEDCYDDEIEGARNNPGKGKSYFKTAATLGAGAILGWFLKDKLD